MFEFLWDKYSFKTILWIPLSPFILLYQTFLGKKSRVTMSEMLIGSFIFALYVHVSYDHVLMLDITWLNSLTLFVIGSLMVLLYNFFPKIDVR